MIFFLNKRMIWFYLFNFEWFTFMLVVLFKNVNVRLAEEMSYKRTLNTLIIMGLSLKYYNHDISLAKIFSHSVEYINSIDLITTFSLNTFKFNFLNEIEGILT